MKAIKILLIALGSIVALLFILSFFAPNEAVIKRSIIVDVSKDQAFNSLKSFQFFQKWSPWKDIDPNATYSFKGTDSQVGSEFLWKGNDEVGTGSMKIVSIEENKVNVALAFTEPWQSNDDVWFEVSEKGINQTEVTWGFHAEYDFPSNVFMMMMNMDEMLGENYETGLGNFKALVEK